MQKSNSVDLLKINTRDKAVLSQIPESTQHLTPELYAAPDIDATPDAKSTVKSMSVLMDLTH